MKQKKPEITPDTPGLSDERVTREKKKIIKSSFIEQELLGASIVQKELMITIRELNSQLLTLNSTLNLIREHEFVELHKSKWRIIAYQIALGMLFAIGTVLGLALISWSTYTFFKDSEILRQIVDKQLDSRNFNLTEIKNRATKDATSNTTPQKGGENTPSATGAEFLNTGSSIPVNTSIPSRSGTSSMSPSSTSSRQ